MQVSAKSRSNLRFGEFELDLNTGELHSNGYKTLLQEKPFQILALLLEHPGELVTRDELMKRLWPEGTFVDFDQSLNKAVNRLREALGDSADQPRFIETLPRRGYRFVAEVERWQELGSASATIAPADKPEGPSAADLEAPLAEDAHNRDRFIRRNARRFAKKIFAGAAVTAVVVAASILAFRPPRSSALLSSDSILVSDFVNTTADPIFDGTLKQALTVKLAESPYFNVVPDFKVRETLGLMGRSSAERVVPPITRELCERVGAKVAVSGSIVAVGGKFIIDVRAMNCLTGTDIAHEEGEAANRDLILSSLGKMIPALRQKLGESVSSIQRFDTPIEQATTKSLAALKAFTTGDEQRSGQIGGGIGDSFYKMAIDLDPDFAMAYARLGVMYGNVGNTSLANEYLTKAFQRREHVSEREKLYIASHYYADSTRELDKAIEILKLWTQTYPNDWVAFNNLSSYATAAGQLDEAIKAGQEALRLNPSNLYPYMGLAIAYFRASRFAEANTICEQALKAKRDGGDLHAVLLTLAFVNGDDNAFQQQHAYFTAVHDPGFTGLEAWMAFAQGQARKGHSLFQSSRAAHLRPQDLPGNSRNAAAGTTATEAYLELEFGDLQQAHARAELALQLMPKSIEVQSAAALVFAELGDFRRAERLTGSLRERFPSDTLLNNVTLPTVQAVIETRRKNFNVAIDVLKRATLYDFGKFQGLPEGITLYQRGMTYLASGSGQDAAVQFQKLIDNRGIVAGSPLWPLAHLGLARANSLEARGAHGATADEARARARTAYQDFLTLWKNADADIPVLKEARSEYAKLQ